MLRGALKRSVLLDMKVLRLKSGKQNVIRRKGEGFIGVDC